MTAAELLAQVYHLFDDKSRWTRGTLARDENGREVWPVDGAAVRWCAIGAIDRVHGTSFSSLEKSKAHNELLFTLQEMGYPGVATANDRPGGRQLIQTALRKTIERLAPDEAPRLIEKQESERELVASR